MPSGFGDRCARRSRAPSREQPDRASDEAAADLEDHDQPDERGEHACRARCGCRGRRAVAPRRLARWRASPGGDEMGRRRGARRGRATSRMAAAGPTPTAGGGGQPLRIDAHGRPATSSSATPMPHCVSPARPAASPAAARLAHLTRPTERQDVLDARLVVLEEGGVGIGVQVGVVPAAGLEHLGPFVAT